MFHTQQTSTVESLTGSSVGEPGNRMVPRIVAFLRGRTQPQARLLRQVETMQLGPRRAVYLIECDGDRFLIAAGGDGVSAPVPLTQGFAARNAAGVGPQ